MMRRRRSGIVLLVVVGVLGVLAILGTAFITMARLERKASQQRMNATKALLLARSGLEDALARMDAGQDPFAAASAYRGEDWDRDGVLSSFEASQLINRAAGSPALLEPCPVEKPSPPVCCGPRPTWRGVAYP